MKNNAKVYVIINTNEKWEDTAECIESLVKSTYSNFQIIIPENTASEDSLENIKQWIEGKKKLKTDKNHPLHKLFSPPVQKPLSYVYYSNSEAKNGGNLKIEKKIMQNNKYPIIFIKNNEKYENYKSVNIALKMSLKRNDAEYIWMLNSETVVNKDALSELINHINENEAGLTGTVINSYSNPEKVLFFGGGTISNNSGTVLFSDGKENAEKLDFISEISLFSDIENFRKKGFFPEEYTMFWGGADWCKSVKGEKNLRVCQNALCYSKIKELNECSSEYDYTLDSLRFFSKFYPENINSAFSNNNSKALKHLFSLKFGKFSAIKKAINDFNKIKDNKVK